MASKFLGLALVGLSYQQALAQMDCADTFKYVDDHCSMVDICNTTSDCNQKVNWAKGACSGHNEFDGGKNMSRPLSEISEDTLEHCLDTCIMGMFRYEHCAKNLSMACDGGCGGDEVVSTCTDNHKYWHDGQEVHVTWAFEQMRMSGSMWCTPCGLMFHNTAALCDSTDEWCHDNTHCSQAIGDTVAACPHQSWRSEDEHGNAMNITFSDTLAHMKHDHCEGHDHDDHSDKECVTIPAEMANKWNAKRCHDM